MCRLYILNVNSLSDTIWKYFHPCNRLPFHFVDISFAVQKCFLFVFSSLMWSHCLFLLSLPLILLSWAKNHPKHWHHRAYFVFFYKFNDFWFYIILIHIRLIFVKAISYWSNFILLLVFVQFSQHHLLKRLSFFHCIFLALLL